MVLLYNQLFLRGEESSLPGLCGGISLVDAKKSQEKMWKEMWKGKQNPCLLALVFILGRKPASLWLCVCMPSRERGKQQEEEKEGSPPVWAFKKKFLLLAHH